MLITIEFFRFINNGTHHTLENQYLIDLLENTEVRYIDGLNGIWIFLMEYGENSFFERKIYSVVFSDKDPSDDLDKIDEELMRYSPELAERPQIIVANKVDSVDMEEESVQHFIKKCGWLDRQVVFVSAITGEGLDELVRVTIKALEELPPLVVYDAEYNPEEEAVAASVGAKETEVYKKDGKYFVEGEWLYNFMGQINFNDYESLNFFQRVLEKNHVFDELRRLGVEEGDTVNIYDFEFDFVY